MKITHFMADPNSVHTRTPIPAKNLIPQWYKDGEHEFFYDVVNDMQAGLKACVPVLDALMSGYFILTSVDLHVKKDIHNRLYIEFGDQYTEDHVAPVDERPDELGKTIPRPAGHLRNHLIWGPNWSWKTPRGYSSLITHPLNGWHLPFTTMSAIVDTDKFHGPGNIPFFLKNDFTGTIPAGTPYIQVIPFKRKKWKAIHNKKLTEYALESGRMNRGGIYKNSTWQKKIYLMEEK